MKVHFIDKTDDTCVMFLCESLKFFNVNKSIKKVVNDILDGVSEAEIIEKYNIKTETYDNICKILSEDAVEDVTGEKEDTLFRLVLNVTNKCNLNCKYCYADGGNYSSSECLMSKETAKAAIDLFYSRYKGIKVIQFFGGEPLLNEPVIRFTCEYITELYEAGKIDFLPQFGTISNGTIYSDQLAETISKYNISITFSIDGPEKIHDRMRVYKNGSGSFGKIMNNMEKYNQFSVFPASAEVTYNARHIESDYSVIDTIKYLKDELNIPNVHIVPVSGDDSVDFKLDNRDSFNDAVDEAFKEKSEKNKDYSFTYLSRIIKSLKLRKSNKYLCEAGISNYSVSCKGDIYPCFMFTDVEKFKMGNIYDDIPIFDDPVFKEMKARFKSFSKYKYEKCKNCFNNRICSGCLGTNYFNSNDIQDTPEEECEMQKKLTEKVLIRLSDMV